MIKWILIAIIAVLLLTLIISQSRTRAMIAKIDKALDDAIAGKNVISEFSEAQSSKLDAKLLRHLTTAKLRQEDLLEAQNKTRELISDISHQTKTSLSNIILNTQLLAEQPELSQDSKELVAQLGKSGEKLSFLIQSLVKVSRLESGTIQVIPAQQSLTELAQSCFNTCDKDAQAKGVALTFTKPETDIFALCDYKWCTEAICNIIDNAIKYTPECGAVSLSLHEYEMFSCVRISDTGKGISETDLPKIYARFYRAANSSEAPGVGIGLYLAREIIHKCGGYIHAESVVGKGSVFSVYLSKL